MTKRPSDSSLVEAEDFAKALLNGYFEAHAKLIRPRLNEFAAAARIENPDSEFGHLVTRAIFGCIFQHQIVRVKRLSQYKNDLLCVGKQARAAARSIRRIESAIKNLDVSLLSAIRDKMEADDAARLRTLAEDAIMLEYLGKLTKILAGPLQDKGGPTAKTAFRLLIVGLAKAFEYGRGRAASVTRNSDSNDYGGDFMQLVKAVTPLAIELAENDGGPRLERPGSGSLGAYVESVTRLLRSKR